MDRIVNLVSPHPSEARLDAVNSCRHFSGRFLTKEYAGRTSLRGAVYELLVEVSYPYQKLLNVRGIVAYRGRRYMGRRSFIIPRNRLGSLQSEAQGFSF